MEEQGCKFEQFFFDIMGVPPFPWQSRLAHDFVEKGRWPTDIDASTSAGKTALMVVFLWALAMGYETKRRLVFASNRRVAVDEAEELANKLCEELNSPKTESIRWVSERLTALAGSGGRPLVKSRIRGGALMEKLGDAKNPLQPGIVIPTTDQAGSRLLMRAYCCSRKSWVLEAGLIAACVFAIDEAHLSDPFCSLLEQIVDLSSPKPGDDPVAAFVKKMATPVVIRLTATPVPRDVKGLLSLNEDDEAHQELGRRLRAKKLLLMSNKNRIPTSPKDRYWKLAQKLASESLALPTLVGRLNEHRREDDQIAIPKVLGVYCNSPITARMVYNRIRRNNVDAILLIGCSRHYVRDKLLHKERLRPGRDRAKDTPLVVVMTQCGEAGPNFDFDGLVIEAASLDAITQRLGRCDRFGALGITLSILVRADVKYKKPNKKGDYVYGTSIDPTWKFLCDKDGKGKRLCKLVCRQKGKSAIDEDLKSLKACDCSSKALKENRSGLTRENIEAMLPPKAHAPMLTPSILGVLTQTSPAPKFPIDIEKFIHGIPPREALPTVSVVFRELPEITKENCKALRDKLSAIPPGATESLEISLPNARRLLRRKELEDEPDIVGAGGGYDGEHGGSAYALRWMSEEDDAEGDDEDDGLVTAESLRPGDVLIVPCSYGHCDEWGFCYDGNAKVQDIGDLALTDRRNRAVLRLHMETLRGLRGANAEWLDSLPDKVKAMKVQEDLGEATARQVLKTIAADCPEGEQWSVWNAVCKIAKSLSAGEFEIKPYGTDGMVLIQKRAERRGGKKTGLGEHVGRAEELALAWASALGLPEEIVLAEKLAARYHDVGKKDIRFQARLHGSMAAALISVLSGKYLAKSGDSSEQIKEKEAAGTIGWEKHTRHEGISAAWAKEAGLPRLAVYLAGSHHGYGRPLFVPLMGETKKTVSENFEGKDISVSSHYGLWDPSSWWPRLFKEQVDRFGPWGLAFLESLMILADHKASSE